MKYRKLTTGPFGRWYWVRVNEDGTLTEVDSSVVPKEIVEAEDRSTLIIVSITIGIMTLIVAIAAAVGTPM